MDAQIQALGSNNDPPSNEVQQEVRQRLAKILQELQNLDSEIINLENCLEELKTKRNATKRTRDQYQSILSPQRRILPEILGEIFYRCLPTHLIITTAECPLLLTHVCSFWRATAMSEPRLWARLHTTFSENDMSNDMIPQSFADQRPIRTPHGQRKLCMMKKWLSLSGITPLSISILFSPMPSFLGHRSHGDSPLLPQTILEIFEFFAQLSPRFEDLELKIPLYIYRVLERMIDAHTMTRLTSLRVDFGASWGGFLVYSLGLLRAPNLKTISISTNRISLLRGITNPSYISAWTGLTDISCNDHLTLAQLILLLAHTPNLVRFKAVIDEWGHDSDWHDLDDAVSAPSAPGGISLPFLRFFSITDRIGRHAQHGSYDRMNAPRLTWVEYICPDSIDPSIILLLQRSPELKKLTVDLRGWDDVGMFWKAVPSITHLVLGRENRSPSGSLVRDSSIISRRQLMQLQLDGRIDLLPLHDLTVARSGSTSDPPTLLPNLASLEISAPYATLQDEDLISLIISRMNRSPPLSLSSPARADSGIAWLKHVGVVFYREREQDIAAKIQKHAERHGADMIDLSLDYPLAEEYVPEAWSPPWAR